MMLMEKKHRITWKHGKPSIPTAIEWGILLYFDLFDTSRYLGIQDQHGPRRQIFQSMEGMWLLCPPGRCKFYANSEACFRYPADATGQVQPSIERELVPGISQNGSLFQCSWPSQQVCVPTPLGNFHWRVGGPCDWEGCLHSVAQGGFGEKSGSTLWNGNLPCSGDWPVVAEIQEFHLSSSCDLIPKMDQPWLWLP